MSGPDFAAVLEAHELEPLDAFDHWGCRCGLWQADIADWGKISDPHHKHVADALKADLAQWIAGEDITNALVDAVWGDLL